MYNDFDPFGEFWTDSNGLEMQMRQIDKRDGFKFNPHENQIARNFYPINSAIAMKDKSGGKLQVTIMNDRPQGGSADLSDRANIEIMQHRRQVQADPRNGFNEALNETDSNELGIKVNALYIMQIFDVQKGKSLQREQQIRNDQPLQYFYAFNYTGFLPHAELVQLQKYSEFTLNATIDGVLETLRGDSETELKMQEMGKTDVDRVRAIAYKESQFPLLKNHEKDIIKRLPMVDPNNGFKTYIEEVPAQKPIVKVGDYPKHTVGRTPLNSTTSVFESTSKCIKICPEDN